MKSMFYKGENISPWGLIFSLLNRKIRKIDYADFQNLSQEEKDGGTLWCVVNAPDIDVLRYYPVGCYFETTDTTFDPNTEWGGTWVLETEGLVHISSGTNYVVSANNQDGGVKQITYTPQGTNAAIKLTASQSGIRSHSHYVKAIAGSNQQQVRGAWQNTTNNSSTSGAAWGGQAGSWELQAVSNTAYDAADAHGHTFTGTQATLDNMQPYKIVNRWHRTA